MKKFPALVVMFNNGHRLELDLSLWDIDPELSQNGTLTLRNKKGEIFNIIATNVNWMATVIKEIREPFDEPPLPRRLSPRGLQPPL